MCRSTDFHGYRSAGRDSRLRIRALFVRFSGLNDQNPLPESITLLYLPRINENSLVVDGSNIKLDSPAFVTLHRVVAAKTREGEVVFGSRERVRAGEGVQFEVYLREEKVLKGIFRKEEGGEWTLECKCKMESEVSVSEAEVCVAVEGHVAMKERVDMAVRRRSWRRKHDSRVCGGLEEIPEGREEEEEEEDTTESDGGCCCSCGEEMENGSDGRDVGEGEDRDEEDSTDMAMEMEGVRWAVDVGIWVMCLGVGFLVSNASLINNFRRRKIL
ncbi:hypothetical protein F2P56_020360 [Juglans regia]|uniref:Uncharacterized protein LOC108993749 n=2 Tax=Juglans regia TaxID=51240 RepID=A0A2I4EY37_JUGRE|nr:uncharacterized protein LOC108993749 [Juglans regia]KAF5460496.1 hypothetical protein F2P56_020360 [Juglans regia]